MAVERPADARFETLSARLAHVVQQGGPAQPELVACGGDIVKHLQRVQEIVLMAAAFDRLDALECVKRGQDIRQQAALIHQQEADRGLCGAHNLVELVGNALG